MKLVYFGTYNPSEILTGPEKVAKRVFDEYTKSEPAVLIEYFQDGSKYGRLKKLFGKEIVKSENGSEILRLGIFRIVTALFQIKPDIVHIITFERAAKLVYIFKNLLGYKILFNLHGIVYYENTELTPVERSLIAKNNKAEKIFIEKSDLLLYLSEFYIKIGLKYYRIENTKLKKIKNGVDEIFHGESGKSLNNNPLKVVFCGDIKRKDKGFSFLKESLENIPFKIELYIVGSIKYDCNIGSKVKVVFAGFLDAKQLSEFYIDKDIFISASYYDTFSIAAAEAMSSGLVPIVTYTTGLSEYIENGINGYKVDYGNTTDLIGKIEILSNDLTLRNSVSKESQNIYSVLNWSEIIKSYKNIYKEILIS